MPNIINQFLQLLVPEPNYLVDPKTLNLFTPKVRGVDFDTSSQYLEWIWVCGEYIAQMKDLIDKAKIGSQYNLVKQGANIIKYQLQPQIVCTFFNPRKQDWTEIKLIDFLPDIITFVPADPKRFQVRGYHLPQILAKEISWQLQIPYIDLLKKTSSTPFQASLNQQNRINNLEGKFAMTGHTLSKINMATNPSPIIWLIDDVCTTGATLHFCAKAIKEVIPNAKIYGIALTGG